MSSVSRKIKYINRFMIFYMILFVAFLCFNYTKLSINVKDVYEDIYNIEDINFLTQRVISLSIANNVVDQEMLSNTNTDIYKFLDINSEESLYILEQESAQKIVQELVLSWELTYAELNNIYNTSTAKNEVDYIDLLLARESYNKNINNLLVFALNYSKDLNSKLSVFLYGIIILAFFQVMTIIYKNKLLQNEIQFINGFYNDEDDDTSININKNKSNWFSKKIKAEVVDINEYRSVYTKIPSLLGKNKSKKSGESNIQNLFDEENLSDEQIIEQINLESKKKLRNSMFLLTVVFLLILFIGFIVQDLKVLK